VIVGPHLEESRTKSPSSRSRSAFRFSSVGVGVMNTRTANRISGVLGMLASLWAIVGILASNVEAPWTILFGLVAVGLLLNFLLQFLGTGLRRKG